MHVNHFFDLAFDFRAGTNNSITESRRRINTAHDEVAHILLDIFGLNMTRNTAQQRVIQTDLCRGGIGGTRIFTGICPANCWRRPMHNGAIDRRPEAACTYLQRIRDQFISSWGRGTQRSPIVLWTGHNQLTATTNRQHRNNAGCVIWRRPIGNDPPPFLTLMTAQTTLSSSNTFNANPARNVLLHEMAHQLGANDHYCYWRHTHPGHTGPHPNYMHINGGRCGNPDRACWACDLDLQRPPNCVMTSSSTASQFNTLGSDIFCRDCQININGTLFHHHR